MAAGLCQPRQDLIVGVFFGLDKDVLIFQRRAIGITFSTGTTRNVSKNDRNIPKRRRVAPMGMVAGGRRAVCAKARSWQ